MAPGKVAPLLLQQVQLSMEANMSCQIVRKALGVYRSFNLSVLCFDFCLIKPLRDAPCTIAHQKIGFNVAVNWFGNIGCDKIQTGSNSVYRAQRKAGLGRS